MASKDATRPTPTSNLYGPSNQAAGKPYVHQFASPDLTDRILSVRQDSRSGGFVLPDQGDPYAGPDSADFQGFVFSTAEPIPQMPGWWYLFYVNERRNQNRYNYKIEYKYVDRDYPTVIRTYVLLRGSIKEPTADETDPVFNGTVNPKDPDIATKLGIDPAIALVLTDHKLIRFENDPIIDALFVGVERTYERLPGPVITSYEENQFQQKVTVQTQEVMQSPPPALSAVVEKSTQERTGTAKAKNTSAATPDVFPNSKLSTLIPSMTRELWLGGFFEQSDSEVTAGQVSQPTISTGTYQIDTVQETEFKRRTDVHSIPLPQTRNHQEVVSTFGGGVVTETLQIDVPSSGLVAEGGYLVTESHMRNLADFGRIKKKTALPAGSQWPTLHEEKVLTEGIYAGIKILIDKKYVPAGTNPDGSAVNPNGSTPSPTIYTPNPGGYTDMMPHDRWKTIQVTSSLVPSSLPGPLTYAGSHPLQIPPTLLSIQGVYGDRGGSSFSVSNDGTKNESVSMATDSGPLGSITHTSIEGFRGMAIAQITRIFSLTAPQYANGVVSLTLPSGAPLNIPFVPFGLLAAGGTAVMRSVYSRFTQNMGGDTGGVLQEWGASNTGQIRVQTTEFRPMFTGQFLAASGAPAGVPFTLDSFTGATSIVNGNVNGYEAATSDGVYSFVGAFQPGNTCTLTINIPRSSPAFAPAPGTLVPVAFESAEWRFGVWVIHLVSAIVPVILP